MIHNTLPVAAQGAADISSTPSAASQHRPLPEALVISFCGIRSTYKKHVRRSRCWLASALVFQMVFRVWKELCYDILACRGSFGGIFQLLRNGVRLSRVFLRHREKVLGKEEGKAWMLFSRLGMRVGVSISG